MTEQEAKIRALVNTVARGEDIAKLDPSIGYMLSLFEVIDAQRLWIANAKRSMGQITSVLWDHGVIASNSEPVRAMLNLLSTLPAPQSAQQNECKRTASQAGSGGEGAGTTHQK